MQFAAIPPCIIHCYKITKSEVQHSTGTEREGGRCGIGGGEGESKGLYPLTPKISLVILLIVCSSCDFSLENLVLDQLIIP